MKKQRVYDFMRNTETEKIFSTLEKSFGIIIDRDAYNRFIASGDPELIIGRGFPVKDTWTWSAPSTGANSIRLIREEEVGHEGIPDYRYDLRVLSGQKILVKFSGEEEEIREVIPALLSKIKKAELP